MERTSQATFKPVIDVIFVPLSARIKQSTKKFNDAVVLSLDNAS
jgi:hypothetical protein